MLFSPFFMYGAYQKGGESKGMSDFPLFAQCCSPVRIRSSVVAENVFWQVFIRGSVVILTTIFCVVEPKRAVLTNPRSTLWKSFAFTSISVTKSVLSGWYREMSL